MVLYFKVAPDFGSYVFRTSIVRKGSWGWGVVVVWVREVALDGSAVVGFCLWGLEEGEDGCLMVYLVDMRV